MSAIGTLEVVNLGAVAVNVAGTNVPAYEKVSVTLGGNLGSVASEWNQVLSLVRNGKVQITGAS